MMLLHDNRLICIDLNRFFYKDV